jgi:DNA-binding NarL/FixJ family response regulator
VIVDGPARSEASDDLRVVALENEGVARAGIRADFREGGVNGWVTGDEQEFLSLIEVHSPHVVLVDLNIGEGEIEYRGLEYIKRVKERWPHIKCVVFTAFRLPFNFRSAVRAAADSFVVKDAVVNTADLVRRIASGEQIWDQRLLRDVAIGDPVERPAEEASLTRREIEVVCELALGKTNDEIAVALKMAIDTVKAHLKSIYRKLNVDNRQDAVLKAMMKGYIRRAGPQGYLA